VVLMEEIEGAGLEERTWMAAAASTRWAERVSDVRVVVTTGTATSTVWTERVAGVRVAVEATGTGAVACFHPRLPWLGLVPLPRLTRWPRHVGRFVACVHTYQSWPYGVVRFKRCVWRYGCCAVWSRVVVTCGCRYGRRMFTWAVMTLSVMGGEFFPSGYMTPRALMTF
jgi:hypothetical protein